MADPQINLLPDDRQLSPDQALDAAVAGALAIPQGVQPVPDPPQLPLGRTWQFDFEEGRFIRAGTSPAETVELGAVAQWCLMAIHSARFAHPVFSDEFGMENPDSPLGEFAVGEILADWQRHLTEALLVHDRIVAVENMDLVWDPTVGVLLIRSFDVVTDAGDALTIDGTIGG